MKLNYKIKFKEGLHSRPAVKLTDLTKKYKSNIIITKINNKETKISCKNLISILASNIKEGYEIEITIEDNILIKQELDNLFN